MIMQSLGFEFDGVHSSRYGLNLIKMDGGATMTSVMVPSITIEKTKIGSRDESYFYNVKRDSDLSFSFLVGSENELDAKDREAIGYWLMKDEPKTLRFDQGDYYDIFFDGIVKSINTVSVGNIAHALEISFECLSPWGYAYYEKEFEDTFSVSKTIYIENDSDKDGYVYPEIEFELQGISGSSGTLAIRNKTTMDTASFVSGLSSFETITINNSNKIITTDHFTTFDYSRFNKRWFRLAPGVNEIELSLIGTAFIRFKIRFKVPKKVGV